MRREILTTSVRPFVLGAALLTLGATLTGCSTATPKNGVDMAALPQEVRDALDRAGQMYAEPLKGAKWSEASALTDSKHTIYQVRGTNGRGNAIEAEVTRAGRVIEVEERGIALDEVPVVVREALNAKVPEFKPKQLEAIYQAGNASPVCYGFEGTDSAGKEVELYISADGKTFLN